MKIPKRFKLYGMTIEVVWDEGLIQNDDHTGQARFRLNQIALMPSTAGNKKTDEQLAQTFMHELTHWILYMAQNEKHEGLLHTDEHLVDRIAHLTLQAFDTMEYE